MASFVGGRSGVPANHTREPFAMQQLLTLQIHHHIIFLKKDLFCVYVFTHVHAHTYDTNVGVHRD